MAAYVGCARHGIWWHSRIHAPSVGRRVQLRLVLIDGGLPAPEPQIWVTDAV